MNTPRYRLASVLACMAACMSPALTCALAAQDQLPKDFTPRPAEFTVSTDIVNADVQPFTFTAGSFGNTMNRTGNGSFEPATFANKLSASKNHANRIYADNLSSYDSYQSGYLDGAEVQVYRIVNGVMKMVRSDQIAQGGSVLEQWQLNSRKAIPEKFTESQGKWADWSRPGAKRWYAVFAVDETGKNSPASNVVSLEQRLGAKGSKPKNQTKGFRPNRRAQPTELPAPENFQASYNSNNIIEFSWDAVTSEGIAGYRVAYTDTDPLVIVVAISNWQEKRLIQKKKFKRAT